jgi:hypothetical protein
MSLIDPEQTSLAIARLSGSANGYSITPSGASKARLGGGSCPNRIADEGFAELPYGACRPLCGGNNGVERPFDPRAVFFRDGQRRQQLDRMVAVARNLRRRARDRQGQVASRWPAATLDDPCARQPITR